MSNSEIEQIAKDILLAIQPSRRDWDVRQHIVQEFQSVVQSVENFRGATVQPFGSFISNLYTQWGDLDISIELTQGSFISAAGRKRQQNLLEDILKALRSGGICRRVMFVPNARVPIVKFVSNHMNISCDVSINNLKGLVKSKFLFWLSGIDVRFRKLVLLIKEWAKVHSINSSKAGTLNSYSLTLLVIFHFQTCNPPIFPPLNEIYPGNVVDDLSGIRDVFMKHIEETCAANMAKFKSDRRWPINRSSISDLLISFFGKFSDMNNRALVQGIRVYTGQWEDIESNMRWQPKTYALLIEDPFEQPENAGRSVSSVQLQKISEAFRATHRLLTLPGQSRNSIINSLVNPQVSEFIPRAHPQPKGRPPVFENGAVNSHFQTREQPHNIRRPAYGPGHSVQRPAPVGSSQPLQVWRRRPGA